MLNCYDSRIDNTDRDAEGAAEEGRVLLPDVQGKTGGTTVSEKVGRYAGTKSGKREIYRKICSSG